MARAVWRGFRQVHTFIALHGVDGVPAGEQHPGLLQGRAARGKVILNDQVLGLLRVHKGGEVGVLPCHLDVHPLPTVGGQSFLDALVGPGVILSIMLQGKESFSWAQA